jgi:hypothetical protein
MAWIQAALIASKRGLISFAIRFTDGLRNEEQSPWMVKIPVVSIQRL